MHTLIIAEGGVNHNGDIGLAKQLIAHAAQAGADVVKFHTFITEKNISVHEPKAGYQKRNAGTRETQFEMVKELELSREQHEVLLAECQRCGRRRSTWSSRSARRVTVTDLPRQVAEVLPVLSDYANYYWDDSTQA